MGLTWAVMIGAGPVGRVAALPDLFRRRGKSELQPGRVLDNVQAG